MLHIAITYYITFTVRAAIVTIDITVLASLIYILHIIVIVLRHIRHYHIIFIITHAYYVADIYMRGNISRARLRLFAFERAISPPYDILYIRHTVTHMILFESHI